MFAENIVFVMVRPSEPGNLGATARVLKNFGFSDLRLVEPGVDYLDHEDRWMSVGAYDLLKQCRVFPDLNDALADVSVAVGTTSGRFRAVEPVEFRQMCSEAATLSEHDKVAWVFGNERNGLTFDELERCHNSTCVKTAADFPVLNVAQAVAITAYECANSGIASLVGQPRQMPVGREEEGLFLHVSRLLGRIEFTKQFNHDRIVKELRSAYQRMRPTQREFGLLNGIVRRLLDRVPERKLDAASTESVADKSVLSDRG
jgi:TrmH family RNA methyltransferase